LSIVIFNNDYYDDVYENILLVILHIGDPKKIVAIPNSGVQHRISVRGISAQQRTVVLLRVANMVSNRSMLSNLFHTYVRFANANGKKYYITLTEQNYRLNQQMRCINEIKKH
jgi:hypothetical protein